METVLLVAEQSRFDEIKKLFYPGSYAFLRASSEREAKGKLLDLSPSFVIVDFEIQGAKEISIFSAMREIDTLVLAPGPIIFHIREIMMNYGVYTSSLNREELESVLSAIRVSKQRIRKIEEKNKKLLERFKREKLLTEAKCLLAGKRGMSEAEAHSYIEKKAMDRRISLIDAAMSILRELA